MLDTIKTEGTDDIFNNSDQDELQQKKNDPRMDSQNVFNQSYRGGIKSDGDDFIPYSSNFKGSNLAN